MSDPLGVVLLLAVGIFAVAIGVVGVRRGRCVALVEWLRFAREERPVFFWYGVGVQLATGVVCLVAAVAKMLE